MKKSTSKPAKALKKNTHSLATSEDFDLIEKITSLMKETGLVELLLERSGQKIHLRKGEAGVSHAMPVSGGHHAVVHPAPVSSGTHAQPGAPVLTSSGSNSFIKSPFVGTFYRSSGPNKDPFVEVGQIVNEGKPLCIIEAMKLMNEIEADSRCKIIKIFPENGSPVEFGEPLFEVEILR